MAEFRKDPVIGRWVIIATERSDRPDDYGEKSYVINSGFCPFCEGNEDKTPAEILAFRAQSSTPNSPGWTLRVVPNKYPALQIEGNIDSRGIGVYDKMNGIGAHEVIIETPNHDESFIDLSPENFRKVLLSYQLRMLDLRNDKRFRYVIIFKNHGRAAGASLEHSHSQLIALPIVPKRVAEEISGAQKHYFLKERCIFCDIIRQEKESNERKIIENDDFIAIAPFASRFPFEIWLLPKQHESHFEKISAETLNSLASLMQNLLKRLKIALNDPPYNFLIHTTPFSEDFLVHYHWHIEIIPKLSRVAGFEWGTGFYINTTPPEYAAEVLRTTNPEKSSVK